MHMLRMYVVDMPLCQETFKIVIKIYILCTYTLGRTRVNEHEIYIYDDDDDGGGGGGLAPDDETRTALKYYYYLRDTFLCTRIIYIYNMYQTPGRLGTGRETSFICVMFDCEIFSGRAPHYIVYIHTHHTYPY